MEATASSLLLLLSSPTRSSPHGFRSSLVFHHRLPCKNSTFSVKRQHLICQVAPIRLSSNKSSFRSSSPRCSSSAADGASTVRSLEIWVLDPAGDGDWRHIGYKVPRPGAFEIASDSVTVGRVAETADIVLPVATVSGTHARLEKKDGRLLVTDLDSTNGTYINERRLVPGFPISIEPGSLLIFGDIHLAMFRVSKTRVKEPTEADDQETEKTEVVSAAVEDTTS
ncbi:hypothetical protein PR202_gb00681 [Eleusine coracana subsp. coracana]|uniref:FHA domain-containing protein n=1 Tax=Eleusine coracana subsp. coracana TaxID=191504 RepID=A0AAV5DUJ5_ELECO|nr:hypothetical protein QOZ80_5BG0426710 [Eleusine coracana subsp. coracana]GJN13924.1 hypothetical protein PR202_gb00681 [Eleusine coracana subsp. coracana]